MTTVFPRRGRAVFLAIFAALIADQASAQAPEVVDLVMPFLKADANTEWHAVETLPGVKWAPLPPKELSDCLPTGDCYARQGMGAVGGRNVAVIAAGARTIVNSLYLRNAGAALGEAAVLESLKKNGVTTELARCPIRPGAGSSNWYRVKGPGLSPGVLQIQTSCAGKPCEGFVVTRSETLPALKPDQLANYSEQCAAGANAHPCRPRSRTRCSRRRWSHSCRRPADRRSTTGRHWLRCPPESSGTGRRRRRWT